MSSVTLVDYMGSDLTVVNAARVSFDKESQYEPSPIPFKTMEDALTAQRKDPLARPNTQVFRFGDNFTYERLKDGDEGLIHYLSKHNHFTPFTHCMLQFRISMPIFVCRQWYKSRIGVERDCGWNEVSRRYVKDDPEFFTPTVWRKAADNVKQGSSETETVKVIFEDKPIDNMYSAHIEASRRLYAEMIRSGVAPEQARMVLPMSLMTEWIETGSLFAYARICQLRLDPHAQEEIRAYASVVYDLIAEKFSISWRALSEHVIRPPE